MAKRDEMHLDSVAIDHLLRDHVALVREWGIIEHVPGDQLLVSFELLQAPGFSYYASSPVEGGACTTQVTLRSPTRVSGTLSCQPLPGTNGSSTLSVELSFSCVPVPETL